jgi:hypothetical protein
MSMEEPSGQETDGRTDIEITVLEGDGGGIVNVHRPESDRAHSVFVGADGGVLRCSCKGHHFRGECSHADAVTARPLVTASAQAAASAPRRVAADGGREVPTTTDFRGNERRATCEECGDRLLQGSIDIGETVCIPCSANGGESR